MEKVMKSFITTPVLKSDMHTAMVAQSKIRQEALKWKTSRSSRKWKGKKVSDLKVDWKDERIF